MIMRQGKTEKTWYDNQFLLSEKPDLRAISHFSQSRRLIGLFNGDGTLKETSTGV
jgi:hypothetical protein